MLGIMAFAAEHPVLSHSEHRPVGDIERAAKEFEVVSEYQPAGDQPSAIAELADRINRGERDIVLMGATGTGKSATAAWLIEKVQRPTLVMAPNKTLAAQLANDSGNCCPIMPLNILSATTTTTSRKPTLRKPIPTLKGLLYQ